MKVLLINPPLAAFDSIYSAIPLLLGQLRYNNIVADALDLNIEFLKEITSPSYLKYTKELLQKIYNDNEFLNKNVSSKYMLSSEQMADLKAKIEKFLIQNRKIIDFYINNQEKFFNEYINSYKYGEEGNEYKYDKLLYFLVTFAFLPFYPEHTRFIFQSNMHCIISDNPLYKLNYEDILNKCSNEIRNIYLKIFEKKIEEFNLEKYDVIGITIPFEQNLYPALTIAKLLKEKTNAKVVLGGLQITALVESFIKHPEMFGSFFDGLLLGEGENSILDYVKYVENQISPSKVSGLVYKENSIIKQNENIPVKNINDIVPPSFDGIDFNNYLCKKISLEFAKGCYWHKCTFCYNNLWKRYHIRKPEKAVDIMQQLQKNYGINYFDIYDDALNINFAEKFADEIFKRGLKINYSCFLRAEKTLTYNILEKLKKSGVLTIFFGIESASKHVLDLMQKGIDIEVVKRILKDCKKLGINTSCGFIFGFPGETEEDVIKTIKFIKDNKDYIDDLNTFKFTIMKSSAMLTPENILKFNITDIQQPEEFSEYVNYKIEGMSEERLNNILKENNIEYTKFN